MSLVLDGRDSSFGGPVNISDDFVFVISLRESNEWHGGKESGGELFSGEDGELIDTHLVGLGGIGVVLVDEDEVLLEDESSVSFFFGSPVGSVLSLPFFEGVKLVLLSSVVDCQDGEGDERSNQKLFSHKKLI